MESKQHPTPPKLLDASNDQLLKGLLFGDLHLRISLSLDHRRSLRISLSLDHWRFLRISLSLDHRRSWWSRCRYLAHWKGSLTLDHWSCYLRISLSLALLKLNLTGLPAVRHFYPS